MRKFSPALLFLLAVGSAQAQWTTDASVNTTVRAAELMDISSHLIADGPDGSTYVSWFENGSGSYQLRMQRLDVDGNRMWDEAGLIASAFPQNSAIFRYDLKSDRFGNAIVAFQDERTGSLDIVAYMIDPDGAFLWGADGVELPTEGSTGLSPTIAPLRNGNTVVAWNTNDSPGRIAYQLIDPEGHLLLTPASEISAATRVSRPVPVATTEGDFILQYELEGGDFMAPARMFAQRFDEAGLAVWHDPVQVSTKTISGFFFPQPAPDGQDGLYIAFNTGNPNNPNLSDVYMQRVRSDGSLWSAEGTRLDNSDNVQKFTAGKGFAWINDDDGLMVPLQVTDLAQGQSAVAVQRVDTAGALPLGPAFPAILFSGTYTTPVDISSTGDGALIIQSTSTVNSDILRAKRVDLSGAAVWSPALRDVSTATSTKGDVVVTSTRDDQAVVVWQDDRTPNGIFAQNITELSTGVASLPASGTNLRLEQNPTDNPVLLMDQVLRTVINLDVFDAQGRTVYSSAFPSTDRVTLPLSGLNPGVYTIRVTGNGRVGTVRWVK